MLYPSYKRLYIDISIEEIANVVISGREALVCRQFRKSGLVIYLF